MKKLFVLFLVSLLLNSCNSYLGKKLTKKSAEDVKVSDMKSACDCAEGINILLEDALDYLGNKSEDELDEDQAMMEKMDHIKEIGNFCSREFGFHERRLDEIEDCRAVKELKKTVEEFEAKF